MPLNCINSEAADYSSAAAVRTHLYDDSVARHYADMVYPHFAAQVSQDSFSVAVQTNAESHSRKRFFNQPFAATGIRPVVYHEQ